jgi:hypothetical protein
LCNCFKDSSSKDDLLKKLKELGIKTYERGGKTTGLLFGNHKFRFNRLGFTEEKFEELNKSFKRGKELRITRGKKDMTVNQIIER